MGTNLRHQYGFSELFHTVNDKLYLFFDGDERRVRAHLRSMPVKWQVQFLALVQTIPNSPQYKDLEIDKAQKLLGNRDVLSPLVKRALARHQDKKNWQIRAFDLSEQLLESILKSVKMQALPNAPLETVLKLQKLLLPKNRDMRLDEKILGRLHDFWDKAPRSKAASYHLGEALKSIERRLFDPSDRLGKDFVKAADHWHKWPLRTKSRFVKKLTQAWADALNVPAPTLRFRTDKQFDNNDMGGAKAYVELLWPETGRSMMTINSLYLAPTFSDVLSNISHEMCHVWDGFISGGPTYEQWSAKPPSWRKKYPHHVPDTDSFNQLREFFKGNEEYYIDLDHNLEVNHAQPLEKQAYGFGDMACTRLYAATAAIQHHQNRDFYFTRTQHLLAHTADFYRKTFSDRTPELCAANINRVCKALDAHKLKGKTRPPMATTEQIRATLHEVFDLAEKMEQRIHKHFAKAPSADKAYQAYKKWHETVIEFNEYLVVWLETHRPSKQPARLKRGPAYLPG